MDAPLTDWIGREERVDDLIVPAALAGLAAALDHEVSVPAPGSDVPALAHWLFFQPRVRQSALGPDGHPPRGGFLPPVPLPRRMWAGGRFEFDHALRVGDTVQRRSRIADVRETAGRHGPLVFVTVRHELHDGRGRALVEDHDIVYRAPPASHAPLPMPTPAATDEQFVRRLVPDAVLLFRYSALTFNGHRIHYDRSYATEVEGYPGLVVHGPLVATLLVDLLRRERPDQTLRRFAYRAVAPLFDGAPMQLCGREEAPGRFRLWARNERGELAMSADAGTER